VHAASAAGRLNWGCSRHRLGNACTNNRNIATRQFERRVLADLKASMLAPDVVAAYVREYHRDFARQSAALVRDRARIERQLGEAERKLKRMLEAFADGGSEFAEIRGMLATAKADKERLTRELASIDAIPTVLTFHPRLDEEYRRQVEALEAALAEPHAAMEAVPRARSMIARIIVTPAEQRGVQIEVVRRVDQVLAITMQGREGGAILAG
jgi:site-specific DNA recombinase